MISLSYSSMDDVASRAIRTTSSTTLSEVEVHEVESFLKKNVLMLIFDDFN